MSKDHRPGGFNRESGYKSDLEIAEEAGTRVNTSFGSGNHNVYVHNAGHTHEHFWYDPTTNSSGYHGANVATANNHPGAEKSASVGSVENTEMAENTASGLSAPAPSGPETSVEAEPGVEEVGVEPGGEDLDDGLDGDGLDDDGLDL